MELIWRGRAKCGATKERKSAVLSDGKIKIKPLVAFPLLIPYNGAVKKEWFMAAVGINGTAAMKAQNSCQGRQRQGYFC